MDVDAPSEVCEMQGDGEGLYQNWAGISLCAVDQKRSFFPRAVLFLDLLPFKGPFPLTGALTGKPPYGKAPDFLPAAKHADLSTTLPLAAHVSTLAFEQAASVKPAPGRDLTLQLVDHYLADGFITSGQVLLVSQPDALLCDPLPGPWDGELKAFSVSLLALLSIMREMKVSVDVLLKGAPKFHETVSLIWVQRIQEGSRSDEALLNMKLSLRGTLRQACNAVQICEMIRRLRVEGETYSKFVQRWNSSCARTHQLAGRKSQSLKLLFEHASEVRVSCFLFFTT